MVLFFPHPIPYTCTCSIGPPPLCICIKLACVMLHNNTLAQFPTYFTLGSFFFRRLRRQLRERTLSQCDTPHRIMFRGRELYNPGGHYLSISINDECTYMYKCSVCPYIIHGGEYYYMYMYIINFLIAAGTQEDVELAVDAASKAFESGSKLPGHVRARHLYSIARHVQKHAR